MSSIRYHIATSDRPLARAIRGLYRAMLSFTLPAPRALVRPALQAFISLRTVYYYFLRVFVCEPLFKAYCKQVGRRVRTGVYIHWVQGDGDIILGDDVVVDGKCSIGFGARYARRPTLVIGRGSFIGHNCSLAIGKRIEIGEGCLLSTDVALRDYDGHPTDPADRAAGRPAAAEDVRPIVLGDNVWVGTRALILKGVRIGDNAIVGAGAVVTRDVPPNAVVAGNPARVIRVLPEVPPAPRVAVPADRATPGVP
jgi:acetyltransferase-like isoleucine patch superfamily enzyme